jgi:catechol 2,3-dioxygenase-like lactoylglutathione lyase family enzyme
MRFSNKLQPTGGIVQWGTSQSFQTGKNGAIITAMNLDNNIKVLFVAGFGPIVRDAEASQKLYRSVLGIPFKDEGDGYLVNQSLDGVKYFALWPLSQAAQNCFGTNSWPDDVPVPQAWIEFDVEDVEKATIELQSQGYHLLVNARKEPWGQVVSRFLGPEGLLIGVTFSPWMREKKVD